MLQHFADAKLDRIFKHEIDRPHRFGLADPIHSADSLFQPHRVPGDVVVDDDVSKLQVQSLAAGVSRDEYAMRFPESILSLLAFLHIHGAIQGNDRNAPDFQKLFQHLLGRYEFGEDQYFQIRFVFLRL